MPYKILFLVLISLLVGGKPVEGMGSVEDLTEDVTTAAKGADNQKAEEAIARVAGFTQEEIAKLSGPEQKGIEEVNAIAVQSVRASFNGPLKGSRLLNDSIEIAATKAPTAYKNRILEVYQQALKERNDELIAFYNPDTIKANIEKIQTIEKNTLGEIFPLENLPTRSNAIKMDKEITANIKKIAQTVAPAKNKITSIIALTTHFSWWDKFSDLHEKIKKWINYGFGNLYVTSSGKRISFSI